MKKIFTFCLLFALGGMQVSYAQEIVQRTQFQVATDAKIVGYSPNVVVILSAIYSNALLNLYNKLIETYADIAYEFDSQLPAAVESNVRLAAGQESAGKALKTSSQVMITSSFAGIGTNRNKQLEMVKRPAGDDLIDIEALAKSGSIFGGNIDNLSANEQTALQGNAMFDIESLLGTTSYSDKEQQKDALKFLQQVAAGSDVSGQIIHLAPKFYVPVMNPQDPSQKSLLIGSDKALSTKEIESMREVLFTKPEYRDYRANYRNMVAMRSVYLDNLLRSYQLRMPVQNGKSVLELNNERIKRRLDQKYYAEMAQASPATVARETLFVLADISDELNDIRNQSERTLALGSVRGLNTMAITAKMLDMQAQKVGKIIACMTPEYEKSALCTTKEPTEMLEELDITKMQQELTGGQEE